MALLVSCFSLFFILIIEFLSIPLILISAAVLFLIVFYLLVLILGNYINNKIEPIYKIIRQTSSKEDNKDPHNSDIIADVHRDVEEWAKNQSQEISRLKDLEKYRKEFVGNVSHELKTPIFNIQGYILTLLEGGLDDPKINKLYLKRTEKSIDRMISIVEDLESITKLESGELKLRKEVFDIGKLVEEIFDMEIMFANERQIKLIFDKPEKPILVEADKKRISDVITNLVVNSMKYGKKKGFVKVHFYDMNEMIMVEISDNGIGIDDNNLPRIFERFYRVDKSRSREQGGTGLGLSIVKHIIEAHKQTINVKSTIDEGTTFTFTLEKAN